MPRTSEEEQLLEPRRPNPDPTRQRGPELANGEPADQVKSPVVCRSDADRKQTPQRGSSVAECPSVLTEMEASPGVEAQMPSLPGAMPQMAASATGT